MFFLFLSKRLFRLFMNNIEFRQLAGHSDELADYGDCSFCFSGRFDVRLSKRSENQWLTLQKENLDARANLAFDFYRHFPDLSGASRYLVYDAGFFELRAGSAGLLKGTFFAWILYLIFMVIGHLVSPWRRELI